MSLPIVEPGLVYPEAPSGRARGGLPPSISPGTISERSCSCGMPRFPALYDPIPFTLAWHVAHRTRHLEAFPNLDAGSRRNLDDFIRWAS